MKRGSWIGLFSLFIIFALIFGVQVQAQDSINAGFIFGLTGAASPVGPVQRDGAILAVEEINENGGVNINGEQLPLEYVVRDDETEPETALRRFRELVYQEKVDFVLGQTFASISEVLNDTVKNNPVAYFPVNVVALDMFKQDNIAPTTLAPHGSAYAAGYASVAYIVNELGYEDIVFFGPAYAFGHDQWEGAEDAVEEYGVEAEYVESSVGTTDFTSYIETIREKDPEIVMLAHWGNDAINVLDQVYETGLKEETQIWFNWMTNVFGRGVEPEALEGVYSLMSWYWNMEGFQDEEIVKSSQEFTEKFRDRFGYPPDPYSAMAYIGVKEAVRGIELANSTEPKKIVNALLDNPEFETMKGPGKWRADHQPLFDYGAFVVKGNGPEEKESEYDLVEVIDAYIGEDYLPELDEMGY